MGKKRKKLATKASKNSPSFVNGIRTYDNHMNSKNTNIEKIIEKNRNFIISRIESSKIILPTMIVAYRRLCKGIEPYELKDPEFYGVPDNPYEIRYESRNGFILDVFDRSGEQTSDGHVVLADLSRYCIVFDIGLKNIYHASFCGNKEQPIPIWDEYTGYGSRDPKDWITYYEQIRKRLNI